MFDEKDYKAAFSQVTASRETHRRIMNMAKNDKKHRTTGFISKVLIAAVMISLLAVTASASEVVRSWFAAYFTKENEVPLSTEQVEYFEENEQQFDLSETHDGFTMELKSAITDGEKAYICIGITAPEDVVLNATTVEGYSPERPTLLPDNFGQDFLTNQNGESFFGGSSIASVEDYDGLGNTQNLVIQLTADPQVMEESPFGAGKLWTLRIENLTAKYSNVAYLKELMDGKYKGQDNFFFTEEEGKLLDPEVVLAEGVWEFRFRFDDPDIGKAELIDTPFVTRTGIGYGENGEHIYGDVRMTSFVLRALGASVCTDDQTFAPDITSLGDIYAVMKNGSRVQLISESGGPGEQQFRAEAPIILTDVDYVLLADGTRLPMPELPTE